MTDHAELNPAEAADRLALRELFDAYAHCADRRDAEGQKALFTDDTRFAVYMVVRFESTSDALGYARIEESNADEPSAGVTRARLGTRAD